MGMLHLSQYPAGYGFTWEAAYTRTLGSGSIPLGARALPVSDVLPPSQKPENVSGPPPEVDEALPVEALPPAPPLPLLLFPLLDEALAVVVLDDCIPEPLEAPEAAPPL